MQKVSTMQVIAITFFALVVVAMTVITTINVMLGNVVIYP